MAVFALAACAGGGSWYDDYCQRKGYQPGTGAFKQCKVEAKKWIDWTQGRSDNRGFGVRFERKNQEPGEFSWSVKVQDV